VVAEAKGKIKVPDLSEETFDDLEMTVRMCVAVGGTVHEGVHATTKWTVKEVAACVEAATAAALALPSLAPNSK
jgi:hypothetical protein